MSDPTSQMPLGAPVPPGKPQMGGGGMGALKNLSALNPNDAALMSTQMNPNMTVREYLEKMGVDVDGPVTQLMQMAQRQMENRNPLNKMRNMAADASLRPGGQPPTMPGVKPMVQPPGAPAPAGMEGLMNRLGGRNA